MAAMQTFSSFNESLTQREREALGDVIRTQREDLLAARSEDARVRMVDNYIKYVRVLLEQQKK